MVAAGKEPESENNPTVIRRQVKEEIVRLLIVCVQSRSPNIGRLLLGYIQPPFNKKKMNEVSLQDPGMRMGERERLIILMYFENMQAYTFGTIQLLCSNSMYSSYY